MTQKDQIQQLADMFAAGPIAFLTGAGVSTDSGIPDYRGAGTPPRKPMNIDEFLHDLQFRKRFWAGASVNARAHSDVKPNQGHKDIATLEEKGFSSGVLTQNVDDLHRQAGSISLVELHGNGNRVICTKCAAQYSRGDVVELFNALNPGYAKSQTGAAVNPDQDAEVSDHSWVRVPACTQCEGILRPDIVYFGETVPTKVFEAAELIIEESAGIIIAGSSLAVNTGIRLVHRAQRRGIPLAVINRGPTAVDDRAQLRIEGGTSQTLAALKKELAS